MPNFYIRGITRIFHRFLTALLPVVIAIMLLTPAAMAQPALLFNATDGTVLYAEDPDLAWHPASITKIMTAYVTFEAIAQGRITLATPVTPSARAKWQNPVKLGLRMGRTLTIEQSLKAMLIRSANDVAVMLAEAVGSSLSHTTPTGDCYINRAALIRGHAGNGGPADREIERRILKGHALPPRPRYGYGAPRFEAQARKKKRCRYDAFITRMNDTAKRLKMTRSYFVNPNGLPDKRQIVTARDMALLTMAVLRDFPQYAHFFAMESAKIGRRSIRATNSLLRTFDGADGMKTGFVCASGYNIVASATRNGTRLIAIVLGMSVSSRRNKRAAALLEYGFETFAWKSYLGFSKVNALARAPLVSPPPADIHRFVRACGGRPKGVRRVRKRRRVSSRSKRSKSSLKRSKRKKRIKK